MSRKDQSEGLSIGYRISYRLRAIALTIYGPAQLGDNDDPLVRLHRERAAKVEAARTKR